MLLPVDSQGRLDSSSGLPAGKWKADRRQLSAGRDGGTGRDEAGRSPGGLVQVTPSEMLKPWRGLLSLTADGTRTLRPWPR